MTRRTTKTGDLFIEPQGQLRMLDKSMEQRALEKAKVECLGLTFESEDARRAHFTQILRERLADPEFRRTPGFPVGTDDDILRMSDPPWYTACPNPFLADFVRVYGKAYDPKATYERDPFAVDTSVGKTDALYKAHGYHTKVPHLAIVPSILHYTEPGDIVLDGFAGSGMTGVAAQWCGSAPTAYRMQLEAEWSKQGLPKPKWGPRRVILNDLGPAATFISANYNLPVSVTAFEAATADILEQVHADLGWMYHTVDSAGDVHEIDNTVWSEVFTCPECAQEIVFVEQAFDFDTGKVRENFECPSCKAELTKGILERSFETVVDSGTGEAWHHLKTVPVRIQYRVGRKHFEKRPDADDFALLDKIAALPMQEAVPTSLFPFDDMWEASRLRAKGISRVYHLFTSRAAHTIGAMWSLANNIADARLRNIVKFWIDSHLANLSIQNRYRPDVSFPYNPMAGAYYVASATAEANPFTAYKNKALRIISAFRVKYSYGNSITSTGDCAALSIPDRTVDYIFTDPPFGDNYPYAELNFVAEAWHRCITEPSREAVVDRTKVNRLAQKTLNQYQGLMHACFSEYNRVLKPGRWITIVFSNSKNSVWRAIQEALGTAGFIVADVRTLDKKQRSFKQVTSAAVKQDLVISAYKPTETLVERFALGASSPEGAWAFVAEHLGHVPVFSSAEGVVEVVAERTAHVLHDRMVAFHVQRQILVPLSTSEFLAGMAQRYPERDGMYFLPTQVAEYDRKRNAASVLQQLSLFVTDEASAIQWVRRELQDKPRSFQDLQPVFMREIQTWAKHEQTIELKDILRQNCIYYDGSGPVPSQIHSYLSTNFRDLRNLTKDDPGLIAKAADRWYVPDPAKQGDLEKLREKALLAEFETYKQAKERRLKLFRTEAVRVGFKAAYDGQDYQTIVAIAAKLPENVLQEDEKLLMYYDVASMRLGDD